VITSSLHVSALHAITKYEITGTVLVVRMTDNKKNCQTNERSQEICSMFIVNDSDVGYFIIQRSAYIKRKLYSQNKLITYSMSHMQSGNLYQQSNIINITF